MLVPSMKVIKTKHGLWRLLHTSIIISICIKVMIQYLMNNNMHLKNKVIASIPFISVQQYITMLVTKIKSSMVNKTLKWNLSLSFYFSRWKWILKVSREYTCQHIDSNHENKRNFERCNSCQR